MSYYHYFKLKKDSYYDKLSIDEIKCRIKNTSNFYTRGDKSILKATMVKWYYEENPDLKERRMQLFNILIGIQCNTVHNQEAKWALEAKEDEDGLCRNRPMSEFDMQETIDNWNNYVEDVIGELLILSCIKFEPDDTYSDTSKNTSDYLRYEYSNKIQEIISEFEDEAFDYEFAKFCIENCDRMTEDEKYNLKHELQENSTTTDE